MFNLPPKHYLTSAVLITAPLLSQATVVVQWGADANMTGGGFGLNLDPNPADNNVIDLSTPALGAPFTNDGTYYPNNTNERSPVFFYTGVQTAGSLDSRLINNTPPAASEMRLGMRDQDGGDGFQVTGANLALWTQDGYDYATGPDHGFLNGGDTNSVSLTSINSSWATNGGDANSDTILYFVIRLGSAFYATGGDSLGSGTDLADPASALWFEYDPLTDITDVSNAGSAATLPNLDNLTAAGVLTTFDYSSDSNIFLLAEMGEFQVNGDVIPEPQTYALLAGVAGLLFAIRRRKRR